jgi:hypothetical protein
VAKHCAATFSVNLQETRLFIHGFSSHVTVLTNTKQLHASGATWSMATCK